MFRKFNFDTEWAVRLISSMTNDDIPIEGHTIVKQVMKLQKSKFLSYSLRWHGWLWITTHNTLLF
jgi:hypothetical protein